jgi:hypothetical protein
MCFYFGRWTVYPEKVCWKPLPHLNRLTKCGVGYRSFTEQYFDSCGAFKDALIAIIATVAKQERVRISQRYGPVWMWPAPEALA